MERNHPNHVSLKSGLLKLAITVVISVSTLLTAGAGNHFPKDKINHVSITSMGIVDGSMSFNLKYDNAAEDKLLITLSDNEGLVLYREILTAKAISKNFKTTSDLGTVVLTITNLKDKSS
ncbi:MAG: hypothetical protein WKF89_12285 [Chitinophagaceae bacterium]